MARSSKPAGDHTGRQTEQLLRERTEELDKAAERMTMTQQLEQEYNDNTVIDYTDPEHPVELDIAVAVPEFDEDESIEVVEEAGTEIKVKKRTVRITETCSPTIGYGNKYEFIAGRKYTLPVWVVEHLDEKGLVA